MIEGIDDSFHPAGDPELIENMHGKRTSFIYWRKG